MANTNPHLQVCYQHENPIVIWDGFKVLVINRGKKHTRYCCNDACVETLRQAAQVLSVKPFALVKPPEVVWEEEYQRELIQRGKTNG